MTVSTKPAMPSSVVFDCSIKGVLVESEGDELAMAGHRAVVVDVIAVALIQEFIEVWAGHRDFFAVRGGHTRCCVDLAVVPVSNVLIGYQSGEGQKVALPLDLQRPRC